MLHMCVGSAIRACHVGACLCCACISLHPRYHRTDRPQVCTESVGKYCILYTWNGKASIRRTVYHSYVYNALGTWPKASHMAGPSYTAKCL